MKADEVRRIALSLPGTEERETWGHPTFRTRDKIFVTLSPDGRAAGVKVRKEHQQTIIASNPKAFSVAQYVGRFGWVRVRLAGVSSRAMRVLIVDAWRRTAPKRTVAAYDNDQS